MLAPTYFYTTMETGNEKMEKRNDKQKLNSRQQNVCLPMYTFDSDIDSESNSVRGDFYNHCIMTIMAVSRLLQWITSRELAELFGMTEEIQRSLGATTSYG